ncbi:hypothetical protein [Streptomyces sp. NBC_01618]|uniref:hypothetical protein n=1 Tax=Streptomyces sp. NBC_01618 TaxID=2975900 RepID=UPI003870AD4A|nr:hypothetical protein OH735_29655 [Streptomyces sp. NBC_01618]
MSGRGCGAEARGAGTTHEGVQAQARLRGRRGFGQRPRRRRPRRQSQVYLSMLDVADPSRRAVIRLILTVTASQHLAVLEDFRDFVRTVRPDTGAAS